jgi:hypothetical protein
MVNEKYKSTIPLGRNKLPIVRTNPGYNNPHNPAATNQWSSQVIKSFKAFIPMEYKLHNEHPHISIPSAIDDKRRSKQGLINAIRKRNSYFGNKD